MNYGVKAARQTRDGGRELTCDLLYCWKPGPQGGATDSKAQAGRGGFFVSMGWPQRPQSLLQGVAEDGL